VVADEPVLVCRVQCCAGGFVALIFGEISAAVGSCSKQEGEERAAVGSGSLQVAVHWMIQLESGCQFTQHLQVIRHCENTIKNYTNAIIEFLKFFKEEDWEDLDEGTWSGFRKSGSLTGIYPILIRIQWSAPSKNFMR